MARIREKLIERRKFIRLQTPIQITYAVTESGKIYNSVTKNISADGLRFETHDRNIQETSLLELKLDIAGANNPVHAKGKVIWKKRLSLEDNAPFDVGIEFTSIEEDNKNTFLKFLCDLIYNLPKEIEDAAHNTE